MAKEKKKKWKGLKAVGNLLWNGDYESPTKTEYVNSPSDVQHSEVHSTNTAIDKTTGRIKKVTDYAVWLASLPDKMSTDRLTQYDYIEELIEADDYNKCLEYIHIRSCSKSLDTGLIIHIDPDNGADHNNEHYLEAKRLVAALELDKFIGDWMFKASAFGIKALLPLKKSGFGILGLLDDERLHPKYIQGYKWFDPKRNGYRYGYVFPRYQKQEGGKGMKLFGEDDVVIFKRKKSNKKTGEVQQPILGSTDNYRETFNLWDPNTWIGKFPLTDYGHSILLPAYEAFVALAKIRFAVEKARLRSAESFALVHVPTDGLPPEKAQEHSDGYGRIINQIYNKGLAAAKTLMHVITIPFNAIKQKIEVILSQQDPNINGLADLERAESRFASAMGLDASVVNGTAGEQGGLGGAGLMDATTAESAQMAKDSNACGVAGVEEILRIHFLAKDGIVFNHDNKPYKVRIHTGDTRAERERLQLEDTRHMQVDRIAQRGVLLKDFIPGLDLRKMMIEAEKRYLHAEEDELNEIYKEAPKPQQPTEEAA